jgi:hypothetical protein
MAGCGTKRMNVGGKVGMHKMPDGTMKKTPSTKWLWAAWQWVLVRATKLAARGDGCAKRGRTNCKMR